MGKDLEDVGVMEILTRHFVRGTGGDHEKTSVRIFGAQGEAGYKPFSDTISDISAILINL